MSEITSQSANHVANWSKIQLIGDTMTIDRKIRYRANPKTSVALKYLRARLATILAAKFRDRELTSQEQKWYDVAMRVLGKFKSPSEVEGLGIMIK